MVLWCRLSGTPAELSSTHCSPRSKCWKHQGPDGLPPGSRAQAFEQVEHHRSTGWVQCPKARALRRKGPFPGSLCQQSSPAQPGLCGWSPAEQVFLQALGLPPCLLMVSNSHLLVIAISSSSSTIIQLFSIIFTISFLFWNPIHTWVSMNGNANS